MVRLLGLYIYIINLFILKRLNYYICIDILRRVSVVIHQHIQKCEQHVSKLKKGEADTSLFNLSLIDKFSDELYRSPLYVYHFVRAPIARMGFMYGIRKVKSQSSIPAVQEIYEFATDLFMKARLSAECSIG